MFLLKVHHDIKNGSIRLQKEERFQEEFKSEISEVLKGNLIHKSDIQKKNTIKNVKKVYNGREKVTNFSND